ncbi:ribbon-helix-helix protein, CopG family [Haloferacaceae archaeon DSL9]
MVSERITVSLDEDAGAALADLENRTDTGRSELVRQALTFYAANFDAATTNAAANLEAYHKMLSGGEHVLLDVDFLHCFLEHTVADGAPDEAFLTCADRVSAYHQTEYESRFASVGELLDWLSFCGFLSVRATDDGIYHVVFPSESMKWFMLRFIRISTEGLPFDLAIEEGVAKVLIAERPTD